MKEESTPGPLVRLDNLEDLKRVIFTQKTLAQEVRREMMGLATTKELATGKVSGPEESRRIIMGQTKLLEKYSRYPTLSEFAFHPSLAGATRWGATFGVAILVKALITDPVRTMFAQAGQTALVPFIRPLYTVVIKELNNPTHDFIIEPMEEVVKLRITTEDGKQVDEQLSTATSKRLLYQLAEQLLMISVQYGIVEGAIMGFTISDMGRRVLLHLIDSDTFLTELTQAHKKFQSARPELSVI